MAYPVTFGTQTSPEPMSNLDLMFNQVGAMIQIPCSASGANSISLTPLANCPALSAYNELGGYRFRAVGTSSGAVTAQYNGLGFLPVYHADGVTQANVADIITGEQYVLMFSQALNSGSGGFFFESPSQPVAPTSWFTPGGRLTFASGTPVMFGTVAGPQTIFFAPYRHAFVPIYSGANIQMYQFTSSLSDSVGLSLSMGGGAQWSINSNFDVFAYLNAGVPNLCAIKWTNQTTRATTLSVFGGFLTNSGSATALTGPATTVTLPINQGTFLGTIGTAGTAGQSNYIFGASASGGSTASFLLCNYYNKVLVNTIVTDNGVTYTYSSATARQARASTQNQIQVLQSDSEFPMNFQYLTQSRYAAVLGAALQTGIAIDTTVAGFGTFAGGNAWSANAESTYTGITLSIAATGLHFAAAMEAADGTNASTFDFLSNNQLYGQVWL